MAPTATIHFFCGKAGAGKSTIASRIAADEGAIVLSEDISLMRLFGDRLATFDDKIVLSRTLKTVVGPLTADLLRAGQPVVLDFQANTRAGRTWFRSLFEQADSAQPLHYVDTADATCLDRIDRRNRERPDGSHHLTEADFRHISSLFEPPGLSTARRRKQYPDAAKRPAVLLRPGGCADRGPRVAAQPTLMPTGRPGRVSGRGAGAHQVGVGVPDIRSCFRKYCRASATSCASLGWSTVS